MNGISGAVPVIYCVPLYVKLVNWKLGELESSFRNEVLWYE